MSELRGLAETALEVLVVVHAKDDAGSALELERDVKAGFSTLLDDLAAAQARADRMEGALRDLEKKMATVAESAAQAPMDAEILVLAFAHMRASILSALTLKSEKEMGLSRDLKPTPVASEPKNSDVQQVKP